jgi:formamidopyrimidine-DNA glycosylase
MPELPDISAYITALQTRILGQPLEKVRLNSVFLLRTVEPPLSSAEGRIVREIRRVGKRIAIGVDNDLPPQRQGPIAGDSGLLPFPRQEPVVGDSGLFPPQRQRPVVGDPGLLWLVIHLMIAGRLHWRQPQAKLTGNNALAAFDFPSGCLILTEAGSKRLASLHVLCGEEGLRSIDPGGIEIFSTDLEGFRAALTAGNHTIKKALTDPHTISGIGNSYSDEILHAAQLSPMARAQKLTAEEWDRLFAATRSTLTLWMERLGAEAEKSFPEKVTAFRPEMAVHGRFGQPCPRCGAPVQRIRYANNETDYCARCQTGGKVLAERGLSRLLGSDFPRTLDGIEALKRR